MKKFTKICMSFCAITIIVGIVLCVVGFSLGAGNVLNMGWNRYKPVIDSRIGKSYKTEGENLQRTFTDIDSLSFEIMHAKINISETEKDEIVVDVPEEYNFFQEGKKLIIDSENIDINVWNKEIPEINVYIPKDMRFKNVDMEVGAGTAEIDSISADKMTLEIGAGEAEINTLDISEKCNIEVGAGNLDIKNYQGKATELSVGAGNAAIVGSILGNTDIECGLGSVKVTLINTKRDYNFDISGGMGEIVIGEAKYSGTGFEDYINNDAEYEMKVECGMGDVTVEFGDTL